MAKNAWRTAAQRGAVNVVPATESPVVKAPTAAPAEELVLQAKPSCFGSWANAHQLLATKSLEELFLDRAREVLRRQMPQEVRLVPQLKVGDLVLRPVRLLEGSQKQVLDVVFGRSEDRKSRTFRARREWEFAPNEWVVTEMSGRGVVCFSEEEPPRGWTHFRVEKVNVGREGKITANVRPCKPDSAKLLKKFSEPGPTVSFSVKEPGTLSGS